MKHLLLFLTLIILSGNISANKLSQEAEISMLTCAPGSELYSLFGHTAIRVKDSQKDMDIVFNFGTFDFNTPHFYLKYAQGLLPYQLSVSTFTNFMLAYQDDQRTVYSQTLKLDSLEKQKLFDLLVENHRPENRSYLYNFLFDNCTTRSRDILLKSLPDKVEWNMPENNKNFWNLLDEYLQASPWVQWGIHTILGQRGNREASTFQYMFLPDYLMYGLNTARHDGQRLAADAEILYQAPNQDAHTPWYQTPMFIFGLGVTLLIILLQFTASRALLNTTALLFFLFTGIVGCLIVFLGAFTEHPITAPNWNILWANPLNLLVIPFILKKNIPRWTRMYLKIYIAILTAAIPAWAIAQPAVPMASVFLITFMIYLCFKLRAKNN